MRITILTLAVASALGVAACNRTGDQQGNPPGSSGPAATSDATTPSTSDSSTSVALNDTAITAKVKAALAVADDLKDSGISVETISGRVILSGKLPSETQHKRALEVVKGVDGVHDVESHIAVGNT